jgi:tryptophanyl-tRNA synthetase
MNQLKNYEVVSCIQPTGDIHIGNYFGAVKNWVQLQDTHRCIYGVVDLHALTRNFEPKALKSYTNQMVIDLLACGIDPNKSTLFVQSLIPEHTELTWVLSNLTNFGEASRQPQFKSYQKKNENPSVGFFTYPILQAADVLIYKAKYVPVGEDQRQHLELCRNISERFNARYNVDCFNTPEAMYTTSSRIMSLTDPTQKMSKSKGEKHFVRLFEESNIIRKKISAAVTDSGNTTEGEMSKGVSNLFAILGACGKSDEVISLTNDFHTNQLKYTQLKEAVSEALIELTTGLKAKRNEIQSDVSLINDAIREMSEEARKTAQNTIYEVKKHIGIKSISHF